MEVGTGDVVRYAFVVFMGLLPIANPFSTAPMFVSLTANAERATQLRVARLATFYMIGVLMVFLFAGVVILNFFGVTVGGLRVAGGIIILVIGLRSLFPPDKSADTDVDTRDEAALSVAFTPLTMPMLSGPGSIAVIIATAADIAKETNTFITVLSYVAVVLGILLTALVCWLVLRASTKVVGFLGKSGIDALTRIMGFFLVAIGVEFMAKGLKGLGII